MYIFISVLIIIDLYPLWDDFKSRYRLQKSYITNSPLDIHFKYLDSIIKKSVDFEGHTACSKNKIKFINNILDKYNIKNIAEIGFNAGHSTAIFLNNKNINSVVSFDLGQHEYSQKCIKYIKNISKNRFSIVLGNSIETVPKYKGELFDLVFIDGGHYDNIPYLDIKNTIEYLSKKNTLLLIDDTFYSYIISIISKINVDKAVNHYIKINKIKLLSSIRGLSLCIVI